MTWNGSKEVGLPGFSSADQQGRDGHDGRKRSGHWASLTLIPRFAIYLANGGVGSSSSLSWPICKLVCVYMCPYVFRRVIKLPISNLHMLHVMSWSQFTPVLSTSVYECCGMGQGYSSCKCTWLHPAPPLGPSWDATSIWDATFQWEWGCPVTLFPRTLFFIQSAQL